MADLASMEAELQEVAHECQTPDWDGYGAWPVTQAALDRAAALLKLLPAGAAAPSLGATPDGAITMEWYRAPRWTLSVGVPADADLVYAALLGSATEDGTAPYTGQWPDTILSIVRRIEAADCR